MVVNDIGTPVAAAGSRTGAARFAEDFDNFLLLLTTQLSNQDPLEPIDPTEFTSQLATFTGVEQAIATNKKLDELVSVQRSGQAAAAVSYLGTTVEAWGNKATLAQGRAEWAYALGAQAATTTISIINEFGQTVRTLGGPTGPGKHAVVWDGLDDTGNPQPDGPYTIQVEARDASDVPVSASVGFVGRVTGVSFSGDQVILSVGGAEVTLDNVISVRETASL